MSIARLLLAWIAIVAIEARGSEPPLPTIPFHGCRPILLPNAEKNDKVTDLVAIGEQIFAVASHGGFYRVSDDEQEMIRLNTGQNLSLSIVWGRRDNEVYAAGPKGDVLMFDGKRVRSLGKPIRTVKRRYHPSPRVRARDVPVRITHLWASSPGNVFATASRGVLLHFNGEEWSDISFGPTDVVVRDDTRLGSHVSQPLYGPLWGNGDGDVMIGKWEVSTQPATKLASLPSKEARDRRTFPISIWTWRSGKPTRLEAKLHTESFLRVGRSPHYPKALDSGNRTLTRFQNSIYRWHQQDWKRITPFPKKTPARWKHWTANAKGQIMADRRFFDGRKWMAIESPRKSPPGSIRKTVLTSDGKVGILTNASSPGIYLGKLSLR